jgi:transcription elongation factor GreA
MKILTTSPIAKALMGKKVGDQVEVTVPRGTKKLKIVKIVEHGA